MAIALLIWAISGSAAAEYFGGDFDPLGASSSVPFANAGAMMDRDLRRTDACPAGPPSNPLQASESIARGLCANPQAAQVWVDIQQQVAALGQSRANYLPTLSGTYGVQQLLGANSAGAPQQVSTDGLSLNWIVFDFGARAADVNSQKALLKALSETGNVELQAIFLTTAQEYYNAVAARAQADAAQRSEDIAHEVYDAADAKAQAGATSLGDRLQAKTAYDQAVMNRVQAEADLKNAMGALAVEMGLGPAAPLRLAEAVEVREVDFSKVGSVDTLLEQVRREHPTVLAAAARLESARAAKERVRAQGWPSVSLTVSSGRTAQSATSYSGSSSATSNYIGVQVTVPIFEGFARNYQIQSASVAIDTEQNNLKAAERQVVLNLWQAYHTLSAATDNLRNAQILVDDAGKSLDVAKGRYFGGVGTLIDLLNAQNTEANARQQKIHALSQWMIDRLQLAFSIGRLGFGNIE